MNEVIEKNASSLARAGYIIVFFGMLTQGTIDQKFNLYLLSHISYLTKILCPYISGSHAWISIL